MRAWFAIALTVVYPVAVFWGLARFDPRWVAVLLVGLALLRARSLSDPIWTAAAGGALLLAGLTALINDPLPLKLYPVLINALLFIVFAVSLLRPPSAIERIARLTDPDLSPAAVRYTRSVTKVWCVFFLGNGAMALVTTLWASDAIWTLYNGLLAYLLMGTLFAAEWLVRQRVRARDARL